MITLTEPDDDLADFNGDVVTDYLSTLANAQDLSFTSTGGRAYVATDGWYDNVYFEGTDLNAPEGGTITQMSASRFMDEEGAYISVATGFDMNSADLLAATHAAQQGDTSELRALFKGLDWNLMNPPSYTQHLVFGGSGGDDNVTLSKGGDELQLDGGNDKVRLGAGDDRIDLDNFFGYQAPGLSNIDAGAGFDILDLSTDQANTELKHGLDIHLDGKTDMGAFDIQLKNAEEVIGTRFADTITGTDGDDLIYGGAGRDTLMGGRGADYLISYEVGTSIGVGDDARDVFVYKSADDSLAGKGHDTIVLDRRDIIDLSLIDPGTKSGKFHMVHSGPLQHVGDLRVVVHNELVPELTYYTIQANLDGDKAPEFEIEVHGGFSTHHLML